MITRKKITSLVSFMYIILILLYTSKNSEIFHFSNQLEKIIFFVAIIIFLIKNLFVKLKLREIITCFIIGISAVITYIITNQSMWLFSVMMIISMKNIDTNKIIKVFFKTNIFIVIFHLLATLFTFLSNDEVIKIIRASGEIRYTLQFKHPNACASIIFWTQMAWIYLNYYKIKIKHIIEQFFIALICFIITDTLTSFLASIIIYLYLFIEKYFLKEKVQRLLYNITKNLLPMLFIFFVSIIILYKKLMLSKFALIVNILDRIFNSRIRLGAAAYFQYGYSIFGQFIEVNSAKYNEYFELAPITFDNIYSF